MYLLSQVVHQTSIPDETHATDAPRHEHTADAERGSDPRPLSELRQFDSAPQLPASLDELQHAPVEDETAARGGPGQLSVLRRADATTRPRETPRSGALRRELEGRWRLRFRPQRRRHGQRTVRRFRMGHVRYLPGAGRGFRAGATRRGEAPRCSIVDVVGARLVPVVWDSNDAPFPDGPPYRRTLGVAAGQLRGSLLG